MQLRYVHSTDIRKLHLNQFNSNFDLVDISPSGVAFGWSILIPRVGLPTQSLSKPVFLKTPIRLSDCVIALKFRNKTDAIACHERINNLWPDLLDLYRGTGARYITVNRLQSWLTSIHINNNYII